MADSVRDLRRTLERERTPRDRGEEVVSTAPSLVVPLLVAAVLVTPLVVLGLNMRRRDASDADPLFQPL